MKVSELTNDHGFSGRLLFMDFGETLVRGMQPHTFNAEEGNL